MRRRRRQRCQERRVWGLLWSTSTGNHTSYRVPAVTGCVTPKERQIKSRTTVPYDYQSRPPSSPFVQCWRDMSWVDFRTLANGVCTLVLPSPLPHISSSSPADCFTVKYWSNLGSFNSTWTFVSYTNIFIRVRVRVRVIHSLSRRHLGINCNVLDLKALLRTR